MLPRDLRLRPLLQSLALVCLIASSAFSYDIDTTRVRKKPNNQDGAGKKILRVPQYMINLPVWAIKGVTGLAVNGVVESRSVSHMIASLKAADRVWGFYPVAGYGSNSSFRAGLAFTSRQVFTKGERIKIKGSYSVHNYQDYKLRYSVPSKFSPISDASVTIRYRQRPRESLYGIGTDSRQQDEVAFNLEESSVNLEWFHDLRQSLRIGFGGSYRAVNVFDGEDPDLEGNLPAIIRDLDLRENDTRSTRVWSVGMQLVHDWRSSRGQPTSGGYEFLSLAYNTEFDQSERLKFVVARANMYHFVNIYKKRMIAVRVLAEATNLIDGSTPMPFYLLRRLGGEDNLRGYRSSRYLDRNLAMISLEYRYPIWDIIDAYVFFEEGRVFESLREDFSLRDWHHSTGLGLRVWNRSGIVLHTVAAFSEEGTQFYLQLSEDL